MSSELFHYLLYFRNKKAQKVFFSIHSKSFFPCCIPWSILNAISYSKIKAHFGAFCWAILFKSINLSFLKSSISIALYRKKNMLVFFFQYTSTLLILAWKYSTLKHLNLIGTSFNTGILLFVGVIHIRHKY